MKKFVPVCFMVLIIAMHCRSANAQNIGINPTGANPNPSAMLDVSATDKGVLIPRVNLLSNTDVTTIANPATSLLVYNSNATLTGGLGYYYWNGNVWIKLNDGNTTNSSNLWAMNGDHISNTNAGHVGIGMNSPASPLQVNGTDTTSLVLSSNPLALQHVSVQISDTMNTTASQSKIGLYTTVKNHSNNNIGVLSDVTSTNDVLSYGVMGNVAAYPGTNGASYGTVSFDHIDSANTYASLTHGKAVYNGVPNDNVVGAVLTNAGNGLMQWSTAGKVAFKSIKVANPPDTLFNNGTIFGPYITLKYQVEEYDFDNNYDLSSGVFTAPVSGLYHFDYSVAFEEYTPVYDNGIGMLGLNTSVSGNCSYIICGSWRSARHVNDVGLGQETEISNSVDAYLTAGTQIYPFFKTEHPFNKLIIRGDYINTSFSGHLIR